MYVHAPHICMIAVEFETLLIGGMNKNNNFLSFFIDIIIEIV